MQVFLWGFGLRPVFYSASEFYKSVFSQKVYKISIDAGCTCPNRDGSKGTGGCIFCSSRGSGEFSQNPLDSIELQLAKAKGKVSAKCKNGKYIAYFQNFTSTYGDEDILLKKYALAIEDEDVVGLDIATRPDCLRSEFLLRLKEICAHKFLMIELGLQTSNEKTGELINRKYSNEDFSNAVKTIRRIIPDCHVVCHLIFGLPGENEADMICSVRFACCNKVDGIKFTNLNVLKGTELENLYRNGEFSCLSMEEYFELLSKALRIILKEVVIHRLTGDGPKELLVEPMWVWNKKYVMNQMNSYFKCKGVIQGGAL